MTIATPTTVDSTTYVKDVQDAVLTNIKKGQEAFLSVLTDWNQLISSHGQTLPSFPVSEFVKDLPTPRAIVANAFDFTGAVLASQRDFAEKVLASLEK